jgi:hypothetical protein
MDHNTMLAFLMGQRRGGGSGESGGGEEWIGDGNTHIWISLPEGRTSPTLGVGVNGTVTVDWGDGTEPNVLTGTDTSTAVYTPVHEYAKPGDYVITLTINGEINFLGSADLSLGTCILRRSSSYDNRNKSYQMCLKKVEASNNVTNIGNHAFYRCFNLVSVKLPNNLTSISTYAFGQCRRLVSINIPDGVTSIENYAFDYCQNLTDVTIPKTVTRIGMHAFDECYSISSVAFPKSVASIDGHAFSNCGLLSVLDFTEHTSVPTLSNTWALNGLSPDLKILVPSALVSEWKAATNWSTYAQQIVEV